MLTRQNRQNMMSIYISIKSKTLSFKDKVYYEGFPKKFLIGFSNKWQGSDLWGPLYFLISYDMILENLSRTSG